ncbi:MAG: cobyrinate a,c-diamide synthase, partial [Dehalococcoidia bacterium]
TGLMGAFTRRGLRVQPFKVGPDYIDPSYHTAVTGRPSRTLDGWLVGLEHTAELFARAAAGMDLCIIEGVMGLFDGRTGGRGAGSTAEIAALLGAPVLLVVDANAIARSAAAIVHGYRTFDPAIRVEGVVLNRIAGEGHYAAVAPPIEQEAGVPVLGSLGRHAELTLPERYLGLVPVTEGPHAGEYFDAATTLVGRGLDLDRIFALASTARGPAISRDAGLFPTESQPIRARIAIARDRAFSFYYADSLDLLEAFGAELLPFSPLEDATLPDGARGVYIGGGFPELFAAELSANQPMHAGLRSAVQRGVPLYAECGGYMFAGRSLTDAEGLVHPMTGILPLESSMSRSRLTLGYHELRTLRDGPIASGGTRLRGHEFHWSVAEPLPPEQAAYSVGIDRTNEERTEGSVAGSAWGSYIHLHFGSDRGLAPRFVETCAAPQPGIATRPGGTTRSGA